ncbi:hypothetical protein KM043_014287 [Ampulex compressa]|nr:hypothetical protein KM043_014287 [Ampulex compressa]
MIFLGGRSSAFSDPLAIARWREARQSRLRSYTGPGEAKKISISESPAVISRGKLGSEPRSRPGVLKGFPGKSRSLKRANPVPPPVCLPVTGPRLNGQAASWE